MGVAAWLLALSCLLRLLPTTAAAKCDVDQWLSDDTEPGYHVVCIEEGTPVKVTVYRHGLNNPEQLPGPTKDESLPKRLHDHLKVSSKFNPAPLDSKTDGLGTLRKRWKRQRWALFTADGRKLFPGNTNERNAHRGVALLFEAGEWRWPPIRLGFERHLEGVTMRTLATRPALIELTFTGKALQDLKAVMEQVVADAEPTLNASSVGDISKSRVDTNMRTSDTAWIRYSHGPVYAAFQAQISRMLRVDTDHFEQSLQVNRYKKNQFYDAHRDYWDPREFPNNDFVNAEGVWYQRLATVLWYVKSPKEGGETWFPRARGGGIPWNRWTDCDDTGVKVAPVSGTGILFYSLLSNGVLDGHSWHCGCPVKRGVKWAANSWVAGARNPDQDGPVHDQDQEEL